jgi:hypothetical protein
LPCNDKMPSTFPDTTVPVSTFIMASGNVA